MKSMLDEAVALYLAIFKDLKVMHPAIVQSLERDETRLLKAARHIGLSYFMIDLPSCNKWLRMSLELGRLEDHRPPHMGHRSASDTRPRFLSGLFDAVFESDGTLLSSPDIPSIQSLSQVFLCLKKHRMECDDETIERSVENFKQIEKSVPKPWPGTWNHDDPKWNPRFGHPLWGDRGVGDGQTYMFDTPDPLLQLGFDPNWGGLRRFSAFVLSQFGEFDPFELRPKHGPGAVSDKREGFVKYDFSHWPSKLEAVFPYDWFASSNLEVPQYATSVEFPSQLHAVPKELSGPRLIAAEPTANQWIQGGIARFLEKGISRSYLCHCIGLHDQYASRDLAIDASRTKRFATVDLSSASDRLSCRLVEYLFQGRHDLMNALHASRTRAVSLLDGEILLLNKFATQGSAVIFPLQTICYAILSVWAVAITRGVQEIEDIRPLFNLVRVFGDDIIVPTDAYPVLTDLLQSVGLAVNNKKSFAYGHFRESCGMDAYNGIDITPAYVREFYKSASPNSLSSVVECSNNLFSRGYWNAADWLMSTVPPKESKLLPVVGPRESWALGPKSFCGDDVSHLRMRYNRYLHRNEVLLLSVENRVKKVRGQGNGSLTQFFFEEPDPLIPYEGGQPASVTARKRRRWVAV